MPPPFGKRLQVPRAQAATPRIFACQPATTRHAKYHFTPRRLHIAAYWRRYRCYIITAAAEERDFRAKRFIATRASQLVQTALFTRRHEFYIAKRLYIILTSARHAFTCNIKWFISLIDIYS